MRFRYSRALTLLLVACIVFALVDEYYELQFELKHVPLLARPSAAAPQALLPAVPVYRAASDGRLPAPAPAAQAATLGGAGPTHSQPSSSPRPEHPLTAAPASAPAPAPAGPSARTPAAGTRKSGGPPSRTGGASSAPPGGVQVAVDWPQFLGKHDLWWNFTGEEASLPAKWTEAAVLGNGLLGASVRIMPDPEAKAPRKGGGGGRADTLLRLHVGRSDIWDRRSPRSKLSNGNNYAYDRARLPVGWLDLRLRGTPQGGWMRLRLWEAVVEGEVRTSSGRLHFRACVHARRNVISVALTRHGGEAEGKGWEWQAEVSASPLWSIGFAKAKRLVPSMIPRGAVGGYTPNPRPKQRREEVPGPPPRPVRISEQALLAGGTYATAWTDYPSAGTAQEASGPREQTLLVSVGGIDSGRRSAEAAVAALQGFLEDRAPGGAGPGPVDRAHTEWWHDYYQGSRGALLSIPDTWLEGFYYAQMHKLGSAGRGEGPLIDLNGPWLFTPTAWADLHWDLNVQLTYLPSLAANHADLAEALVRFMQSPRIRAALRGNVPARFQKAGSLALPAAGSSNDAKSSCYWSYLKGCLTEPGTHKGAIVGNLLWICHVMFLQYRYTMEADTLYEVVYPVLHGAVMYYLQMMKPGKGGRLQIPPTASPEYKTNGPNTNYDLALLRWGLQTLLWCAQQRRSEAGEGAAALLPPPMEARWHGALKRLPEAPQSKQGLLIAEGVPLKDPQRHFSHLLGIYPLHLLSWEQDAGRDLMVRSIDHWVGKCEASAACVGYSRTGASMLNIAIGRAEAALGNLTAFLADTSSGKTKGMGPTLGPNTLYGETCKKVWGQPCPCIEAPLHAADVLQGMLLQSGEGVISVFPAVPATWSRRGGAAFHRLRAEGAFLVSASWRDGASRFVMIESLAGEPCIVRPRVRGPVQARLLAAPEPAEPAPAATWAPAGPVPLEQVKEGVFEVPLAKGQVVVLSAEGDAGPFTIEPVAHEPEGTHYWGKH